MLETKIKIILSVSRNFENKIENIARQHKKVIHFCLLTVVKLKSCELVNFMI